MIYLKALPKRCRQGYLTMALAQNYLNDVFVLLPLFDEASFYSSVDNVYSRDVYKADPLDHWMVRIVLAIANASMSEQRGDQHYSEGVGHVCEALGYAEAVLHPGNLSGVQALTLLAQYAMLDPHHFDSWSLIGAASRAMTDLGLHQGSAKRHTYDQIQVGASAQNIPLRLCARPLDIAGTNTGLFVLRCQCQGQITFQQTTEFGTNIPATRTNNAAKVVA